MNKKTKWISLFLTLVMGIMFIFAGAACAPAQTESNEDEGPITTRDWYRSMKNVKLLNDNDFNMMFNLVFVGDTREAYYTLTVQPLFFDMKGNYSWYYKGEYTTFSYSDGTTTYTDSDELIMTNNYVVTYTPRSADSINKYMIFGMFRDSTYFLYTFRVDWENKIIIPDGGVTFTYPVYFEYSLYWKDYCSGRTKTITQWQKEKEL